jgi:hypothetical protein|nr:MAG TPA: hypothetical protein [Caudoviricetes sp.]
MGETVNETKRKSLRDALSLISRAIIITESVCDKEQDAMDNLPENLQCTERFEAMENAVDNLNDAVEKMEEAKSQIEAAM